MTERTALVLLLALGTAQGAACTAWAPLPVKLFNDAALGNDVLNPAKEEAAWLLKTICVDVIWVPCRVVSRSNLVPCKAPAGALELHILSSRANNDFSEETLGIAMPHLRSGDHAGVFLSSVRETVARNMDIIHIPSLLGCVMAHEVGHLLLHSNAHSTEGLMRAQFRPLDLKLAAHRQLKFTPEEGEAIQRNARAQVN